MGTSRSIGILLTARRRVLLAAVATVVLQLPSDGPRAEPPAPGTEPMIASVEASIAQVEQAIAAEEASIQSQIEEIADVGTPWFDDSDHHPIIDKFLEMWNEAKTPAERKHAIGRLRWALGEWRLQIPGDDFGFGGGERLDYYKYWSPKLQGVGEIAEDIEESLQRLMDLQAGLDGLRQTLAGLTGTATTGTPPAPRNPGRDAAIRNVQDAGPRPPGPRMPTGQTTSPRAPSGRRY